MTDAADFYTGLIAELYEPLAAGISGSHRFIEFVRRSGEPALELGCGTGLPMLDLMEAGLDVEGIDASEDMLKLCRESAGRRGLDVTLHHAKMQDFAVPRRYRSVYVANGSIALLPTDEDLQQTLARIRECLHPDGTVLIDLDIPDVAQLRSYVGSFRETQHEGCKVRVGMTHLSWHEDSRRLSLLLKYERIRGPGEIETLERVWDRTVWTLDQFTGQLVTGGFSVDDVHEQGGGVVQISARIAD